MKWFEGYIGVTSTPSVISFACYRSESEQQRLAAHWAVKELMNEIELELIESVGERIL